MASRNWDEDLHPRVSEGKKGGGRFAPKSGGADAENAARNAAGLKKKKPETYQEKRAAILDKIAQYEKQAEDPNTSNRRRAGNNVKWYQSALRRLERENPAIDRKGGKLNIAPADNAIVKKVTLAQENAAGEINKELRNLSIAPKLAVNEQMRMDGEIAQQARPTIKEMREQLGPAADQVNKKLPLLDQRRQLQEMIDDLQGGEQAAAKQATPAADTDDVARFQNMFKLRSKLMQEQEDTKMYRANLSRIQNQRRKNYNDPWLKQKEDAARKEVNEHENRLAVATREFNEHKKDVKPLDPGGWKKTDGQKALAGGWTTYENEKHPEYGKVEVYKFGGWGIQRVAAQSQVVYGGGKFEWSGPSAADRAKDFIKKYFGID